MPKKKKVLTIDEKKLKELKEEDSVDTDEVVTDEEPHPYQDNFGKH